MHIDYFLVSVVKRFLCGWLVQGLTSRLNWGGTQFQARLKNGHWRSSMFFLCIDQGRAWSAGASLWHCCSTAGPDVKKGWQVDPQLWQLPRKVLYQLFSCRSGGVFYLHVEGYLLLLQGHLYFLQVGSSRDQGGIQSVLRSSNLVLEVPDLCFPSSLP